MRASPRLAKLNCVLRYIGVSQQAAAAVASHIEKWSVSVLARETLPVNREMVDMPENVVGE